MEKYKVQISDTLVSGQVFVDELEELIEQNLPIFGVSVKQKSKDIIKAIRKRTSSLYDKVNNESVSDIHELNCKVLREINGMSVGQKLKFLKGINLVKGFIDKIEL